MMPDGYCYALAWGRKVVAYELWRVGLDTYQISRHMQATEAAVYNAIHQVKERLRAENAA